MTPFSERCHILAVAFTTYRMSDGFRELIATNDLGFPWAWMVDNGYGTLEEQGEAMVEQTWKNLCDMLKLDPEGDYYTLTSMLEESPVVSFEED